MADNVTSSIGTEDGVDFATDDIGGVHYPLLKWGIGALNSFALASGGNGAVDAGTLRVTIASDTTGVLSVDDNGGALTVDNGGTFATQATLQAGTAEVGKLAAGVAEIGNVKNAGTFAVQSTLQAGTAEVGKLAAGVAEIGNVKNAGTFVVQVDGAALTNQSARGTGGSKVYHNADLNLDVEITDTAISTVYWVYCVNTTSAVIFLSIWDADSADIAIGSDAATYQFEVPTQGDTNGAGFTLNFGPHGIAHTTGLSIGAATTAGGSTDPNGVSVVVGYQD